LTSRPPFEPPITSAKLTVPAAGLVVGEYHARSPLDYAPDTRSGGPQAGNRPWGAISSIVMMWPELGLRMVTERKELRGSAAKIWRAPGFG
jgi:hypothetical protein